MEPSTQSLGLIWISPMTTERKHTTFVFNEPKGEVSDQVTMKGLCDDSWRGWIEIITSSGNKKCTYKGKEWYMVDGDLDERYSKWGAYNTGGLPEGTNGQTIILDC